MPDLTPAERAALNELPYSAIPYDDDARRVVVAVRPHLYREAADYLDQLRVDPSDAPMSAVVLGGIHGAAEALRGKADREADRDV